MPNRTHSFSLSRQHVANLRALAAHRDERMSAILREALGVYLCRQRALPRTAVRTAPRTREGRR